MKTVSTISLSLESYYLASLDRLAKTSGSRSEAVRRLLEEHDRIAKTGERERAYADYYRDPSAARRDRELTNDLLAAARRPGEAKKRGGARVRRKRPAR